MHSPAGRLSCPEEVLVIKAKLAFYAALLGVFLTAAPMRARDLRTVMEVDNVCHRDQKS